MQRSDRRGGWCDGHKIFSLSRFFIGKAEQPDSAMHPAAFACRCCACPCMHVPFRYSGGLRCAFIRSCEPIGGGPTCISVFKRRTRSRVCAFFCRITRARICASFLCRYRVRTCTDIHPDTFPGSSYARERPRARAFAPRGLTYHSMLRDVP